MGRTIKYAVRNLNTEVKEAILRAFEATGVGDYYDGDLASYFQVIAQVLESRNKRIEELEKIINNAKKILEI